MADFPFRARPPRSPLAGKPMSAELPPPNSKRWTIRRKAAILAAVRAGQITLEEACRCYQLTGEEFLAWQHAFEAHGLPGLRVTRLQQYRYIPSSQPTKPRR